MTSQTPTSNPWCWIALAAILALVAAGGWTYAFCSEECRDLFARTPDVHVVRLAHDPEACMGHRCVFLRQLARGSVASEAIRVKEVGRE